MIIWLILFQKLKNNNQTCKFFDNNKGHNFYYVHSSIENIGKIISIVKIDGLEIGKNDDLGMKLSMHCRLTL